MAAPVNTTYQRRGSTSPTAASTTSARRCCATPIPPDYPLAADVRSNVLVYSAATLAGADRRALQSELIRALADGPGVVVFEGAFSPDVVDRASEAFFAIIDAQRAAGAAAGDHFGKPGANDRIWNAAQKLALHAPRGVRRVLRQRRARRRLPGLAGPALSGHLTGQRRQSRWRRTGSAPRLPPRLRARRAPRGSIRRICTAPRRC